MEMKVYNGLDDVMKDVNRTQNADQNAQKVVWVDLSIVKWDYDFPAKRKIGDERVTRLHIFDFPRRWEIGNRILRKGKNILISSSQAYYNEIQPFSIIHINDQEICFIHFPNIPDDEKEKLEVAILVENNYFVRGEHLTTDIRIISGKKVVKKVFLVSQKEYLRLKRKGVI